MNSVSKNSKYIIIQFLAFLGSCSPNGTAPEVESKTDAQLLVDEVSSYQERIDQLVEINSETGSVSSVSGLTISKRLSSVDGQSTNDLDELDRNGSLFGSDEPVFEFESPSEFSSDFSPPVMVNAASLLLTKSNNACEELVYREKPPSFRELVDFSQENDVCGEISVSFCIRMAKSSKVDSSEFYGFLLSPSVSIEIPCKDESFNGLALNINGGAESTNSKSVDIQFEASQVVDEVYLSNSSGCEIGGSWSKVKSKVPWTLGDEASSGTSGFKVYGKFKDLFGQESTCVSSEIDYLPASEVQVRDMILKIGNSEKTNSSSVALTIGAIAASEMYLTNTPDCGSGGIWEAYSASKGNWVLGQKNTIAKVYIKFRTSSGLESDCLHDSIIHDDQSPTNTSLLIDGGTNTNESIVDLSLAAIEASEMYITNTSACVSGGVWEAYSASKNGWFLAQANSTATVYAKFRDDLKNESECNNDSIVHDNIGPLGVSILIDGGTSTNNSSPNLSLEATGATEMYVTNTSGCASGGSWESYSTSQPGWALAQTNTTATVYVKFRDASLNESGCVNDTIIHDDQEPASTSISIDGGTHTSSSTPDLSLAATDASEMYITNTAACGSGGTWETYASSKSNWAIAQSDAIATVYVKFRDSALNESSCINDTIVHDGQDPTSPAITIDGGAQTNNSTPGLTISAVGASEMYITNTAGCGSGGAWEAYAISKASWSIAQSNTTATVYIKFRDEAGNESTCVNDSILHDDIGPSSPSISIASGAAITQDTAPDLTLSAVGASEMYITNISGCASGSNWQSYSTSRAAWGLNPQNSTTIVYVKFRDTDGNESTCVSDDIVHDNQAPSSISIKIGANESTNDDTPPLTIGAAGATEMYITNTAGCGSGGAWEAYATSKASWMLAQLNANATVYIKFRDEAGNVSSCATDSTSHDNTPPTSPSIMIGSGDYTSIANPNIYPSATDANQMYITNISGCASGGFWVSYSASQAGWNLAQTNTAANVYIAFRDILENTSSCVSDTIIHDNVSPSNPGSFLDGDSTSQSSSSPTVSWTASTDATAGILGYELSIGTSSGASNVKSWTSVGDVTSATLTGLSLASSTTYYVNIKAIDQALNESSVVSGDGFVYVNADWEQEAYLKAANTDIFDNLGMSIAISGDTMVVGAPGESSNATGVTNGTSASTDNSLRDSGAAYVFKRSGSTWVQEAYLKASNPDEYDLFGCSVAISGDTIVIGAAREDSNQTVITNGSTASADDSTSDSGAVYVFKRTGSNWTQEAYIKASNADSDDEFGSVVAIESDTLVVGSSSEQSNATGITNGTTASSDNSVFLAGAAYVYKRTGSNWAQEAYIKGSNTGIGDHFGGSVSISGDSIVVGAIRESSNQTGVTNGTSASSDESVPGAGAAYVFKRTGANWAQEAYLKAANTDENDAFGISVSISSDTIVVGARGEASNETGVANGTSASADDSLSNSGAAYVFKRTGVTWAQEAYLKAANTDSEDYFGASVAISGDKIVVGAGDEASNATGVSIGTTASSDNSSGGAGAAYIFERSGSTWLQNAYIKAANTDSVDRFGMSVSISGSSIAVGAYQESSDVTGVINGTTASENDSASESGAAYVFDK